MVRFFEKCGYYVNSPNKKQNPVVNAIDGLLALLYIIFSFINSRGSTPSELVFYLNAIALGRLMIKNIIEQSKITKARNGIDILGITLVHVVKITLEGTALLMLTVFYLWGRLKTGSLEIVSVVVWIVLIVTLFENIWAVFERLYDAVPKPLKC